MFIVPNDFIHFKELVHVHTISQFFTFYISLQSFILPISDLFIYLLSSYKFNYHIFMQMCAHTQTNN